MSSSYTISSDSRGVGAIAAQDLGAGPTSIQPKVVDVDEPKGITRSFAEMIRTAGRQLTGGTPPFPGAVFVPASGGVAGHWTRPPSRTTAPRRATVRVTDPRGDVCLAAGIPLELIPACKSAMLQGATIEQIIDSIQAQQAQQEGQAPSKSKLPLLAAAGVAGLVLFLFLRKKKRKSS